MSVPSGITPSGSFELAGFDPELEPPAIVADLIDPTTGDFASLTRTAGIADSIVQFSLSVERGSGGAVRNFGHRFREITHVDEQSSNNYEAFGREALEPGVKSGTIRVDSFIVARDEIDPTQLNPIVTYADLLAPPRERDRNKTFSR